MKFDFLFQSSPWLVLLCLLVGLGYSIALYQKKANWSKSVNYTLAALRFVSVSLLCLLLLNFLIRHVTQTVQKKSIVLAIDNSMSMTLAGQASLTTIKAGFQNLKERLEAKDYVVSFATFDQEAPKELTQVRFDKKITDLSALLSGIKNAQEGSNLVDVVLVSDGIHNQGINPAAITMSFAVHTVGLGDTIPKKDIRVKSVYANKVAYLGNKFPIQADIAAYGFAGKTVIAYLKQGKAILDKQIIAFKQQDDVKTITFNATATQVGVQHLVVETEVLSGEVNLKNNRQDVYVEVMDGKEKVLLLALAPHPDIKALKSIIEKNQNYELDVKILSQNPVLDLGAKKYDLLILHQLPDYFNSYASSFKPLLDKGIPCLFVIGNQSGTSYLNQLNQVMQISSQAGQSDKVTATFNENVKVLNFEKEPLGLIKQLPQIAVPFGEFKLLPNSEVLLYQKIGATPTQKPLFVMNTGAKKSAIFAGEGLWAWRLEEFQLTEKQEIVDDLVLKVLQYISTKDDKRKLRVYPISPSFNLGDKVVFETEIYNAIYEKLYDLPIKLIVKDEKAISRTYNYSTSADNSKFKISTLPAGVYHYTATSTVLGKAEQATGEFVIQDIQVEMANTTADFDALRQLSVKNNGQFFQANQLAKLEATLLKHQVPDTIDATEDLNEMINLGWLLGLFLVLLTTEWILRKYLGGY